MIAKITRLSIIIFYKLNNHSKTISYYYLVLLLKIRKIVKNSPLGDGNLENNVIEKYFTKIKQTNGVIFDIGASTGSFFEPFLNGWTIYAFDPDPNPLKTMALQYFSKMFNVKYIDKACSNQSGEKLTFYSSSQSTGISSLHPFHDSHEPIGIVETIRLDDFINSNKISKIDLLKVDAEGHDKFILEGFAWSKLKPNVIVCEFEDDKTLDLGYNYKNLGDFILDKGYYVYISEWYPVIQYGMQHRWRCIKEYPCELEDSHATGNFICFLNNIDKSIIESIIK